MATADVTVYVKSGIVVQMHEGDPPADQSQEVAALKQQVAQLTADLATATAQRDELQKRNAAAVKVLNG